MYLDNSDYVPVGYKITATQFIINQDSSIFIGNGNRLLLNGNVIINGTMTVTHGGMAYITGILFKWLITYWCQ